MRRTAVSNFLRSNWPAITIGVTAAVIVFATAVMLHSLPPRVIVMATGPEGGAYYEFGKRYRAELARANIEVRLVTTAGAQENRRLLLDPRSKVDVALMQGGILKAGDSSGLESLGTIFYEPLWVFRKREDQAVGSDALRGRKISIGPEGSGTRVLALELLRLNGIEAPLGEWSALPTPVAAEKLLAGEIDVIFMMAPWANPVVQQLLDDERIGLLGFARADAYVALFPYLNKVVVPRGVRDLARDLPPADVVLIAAKASLVVRQDLHPAIQFLLLSAANQIHSGQTALHRANEFPAPEAPDIPLSSEAVRFYKSGPPFLHGYLPFWAAVLFGKLIILLIPILGVLYPMIRFLPGFYGWMMRSKVLRLYGELALLENEIKRARASGDDLREMMTRFDRLEEQVGSLKLPVRYGQMIYDLKDHIRLVRASLNDRADKTA
jgi:TRAP-type uncharacterized transport system substrate-binding protein